MFVNITGYSAARRDSSRDDPPTPTTAASVSSGRKPVAQQLHWRMAIGYALVHLGALTAPFFFTWKAVALTVVLTWITYFFGFCLGFHRLITHGSYRTFPLIRYLFAFIGSMGGPTSVFYWVAAHRKHHAFADDDGDPHSPQHGRFWSYAGWMLQYYPPEYQNEMVHRFCPDLVREPMLRRFHAAYVPMHIAAAITLFCCGYVGWDAYTGASFVAWAFFVRLVLVLHFTLIVNTVSHITGYRNYETDDDSRNVWWLGALAGGEGWHNNHHAFQRMARHGHRWWELDPAYAVICLMEKCGLAWDVVHGAPQRKAPAAVEAAMT